MGAAIPLAGGLLGGGAGLGGLGTILEIGFGVIGAMQQRAAGEAEAAGITAQAEADTQQAILERKAEQTEAARDAAERSRRLRVTLAEQNAIFGGSGADARSGSFGAITAESARLGEKEIESGLDASQARVAALRNQATSFRRSGEIRASAAKSSARTAALGGLLNTVSSVAQRG